jgi:PKD domain/Phosphate-induced protein 1 conserved region
VPTFARSFFQLAGLRPAATRRLAVALCTVVALLLGAVPAGAVVTGSFGEQQRAKATVVATAPLQYHLGPVLHSSVSYTIYWDPSGSYNNEWKRLIDEYMQSVGAEKGTLGNVFALNGQYRDASGRAANESIYHGAYTDEHAYPTTENCTEPAVLSCLTDQQIRTELQRLITLGALPGATGTAVYYILTPPGVTVCDGVAGHCSNSAATNNICGYHSVINPGVAGQAVYAVQPWVAGEAGSVISQEAPTVTHTPTAADLACQDKRELDEPNQLATHNLFGEWTEGLADVIINDLSVEQNNVVTDPLLNGWYQSGSNAEQSDMCQWAFGPPPVKLPTIPEEQLPAHAQILSNETINGHHYYLQWAFDSVGVTAGKGRTCWSGVTLEAHYTAPNPVNVNDVVAFDATESLITLNAHTEGLPANEPYVAPIYKWDFGDGTGAEGTNIASEFHSYAQGGTYNVTLTVTDSSGNSNTFTRPITVVGGSPGSAGPGAATATPGVTSPAGSGTGTKPTIPGPVATQAVTSKSLRKVLRSGLVISYSVNEQVAGQFQVLLAASVAKRIGLHGAPATGLAVGTPPQIVIAKAILITTKGGRNTVKILFGKKTAAKLRKLHKVTLMVRLVVRNASHSPLSTTVLSTVNLSR